MMREKNSCVADKEKGNIQDVVTHTFPRIIMRDIAVVNISELQKEYVDEDIRHKRYI